MFGNRLKKLRTERGFTQDELGEKLNVSGRTIGAWERGTREPSIDKINKIANILSVSTDFLLGKSDKKSSSNKSDDVLDIDENSIMTFEGKPIPPEDLKVIKRILRSMRESD